MGGGTEASLRWRKIRVITDSCVMAAMIRRAPQRHNGRSQGLARPCRRSASARYPPPTQWRKTGCHIQIKDATQQSCPVPIRGSRFRCSTVDTLLARGGNDCGPELAVRRQTAGIEHQVGTRQGHERRQLLQELQR
jgi:hypothetical protein